MTRSSLAAQRLYGPRHTSRLESGGAVRTTKQLLLLTAMLAAAAAPSMADEKQSAGRSEVESCQALGLSRCPQPFDPDLPSAADMLTWDQHTRLIGFRNTYRLYQGDVFHPLGGKPYPLPPASHRLPAISYQMDGHAYLLDDYLRRQSVAGLLILKDGRIVYEYYGGGNGEQTLWTSRSVAKSVVSILVGMALKEGSIHSLADPITRYLAELKGTAWDEVTLRDLLQHTSGVAWNEHYADPTSDFAHLTQCESSPAAYQCVLKLVATLRRVPGVKPGDRWSYNTGGAWLVGRVLEQATGMTIARYLETRLWSRFAMERDGVWEALLPGRVDMGGHGFNATLRDWGRFALFVANGGRLATGEQLLPADWIAESTRWTQAQGSVTPATPDGQYGYQWWASSIDPARLDADSLRIARETFWAEGIYGQAIAINPTERLQLVQWSTWQEAETPASLYEEQTSFFIALARALKQGAR
jgi:CubicO group peptidase (beta-lactamase class C family)